MEQPKNGTKIAAQMNSAKRIRRRQNGEYHFNDEFFCCTPTFFYFAGRRMVSEYAILFPGLLVHS